MKGNAKIIICNCTLLSLKKEWFKTILFSVQVSKEAFTILFHGQLTEIFFVCLLAILSTKVYFFPKGWGGGYITFFSSSNIKKPFSCCGVCILIICPLNIPEMIAMVSITLFFSLTHFIHYRLSEP